MQELAKIEICVIVASESTRRSTGNTHKVLFFVQQEEIEASMVEETLTRGMVRILALDIKKLSDELPDELFWNLYLQWQNNDKGALVKKWADHKEHYSLRVISELVRLCKISWPAFCLITVSELAEYCGRSKKLIPHKMHRTA